MVELALDSSKGHDVHAMVLEGVESDDGTDAPRLGRLLRLASSATFHRHANHDQACDLQAANRRRLFAVAERWAWKVTDPNAQYGVQWALDAVGLWKSYDLRERLSREHFDEQVREFAGAYLNNYFDGLNEKGWTREKEKEEDERLKKPVAP